MKPEIKEKITATNQKYLKKFLTEEAPVKLESQLEHMDWSYLDMIHNKEQQRGTFSPLAAMELSEIEANKDKYLATGLDAVKNGKVGAILLAGGQGTRLGFDKAKGMFNIGKTKELSAFPANDYTDDGQLLGHIIIGSQMVKERIDAMPGFPKKLESELIHCILAHHGELEYGSPKKPALIEAMALNLADNADAKMETMTEILRGAGDNMGWLGYNRFMETNVRRTSEN